MLKAIPQQKSEHLNLTSTSKSGVNKEVIRVFPILVLKLGEFI